MYVHAINQAKTGEEYEFFFSWEIVLKIIWQFDMRNIILDIDMWWEWTLPVKWKWLFETVCLVFLVLNFVYLVINLYLEIIKN